MPRLISVFLVVVILTGCKTSFKSNFTNFNAYYNTFYNAKKSFNSGQKRSEAQARKYNPLQPIRIYQTPLGSGAAELQNAIDKGAEILRKYEDSKWVDDALEIIGKSFFYRREYFSADQKFDELYISTDNIVLKQRAVFWKGRVLLELELYDQGVQYLSDQLALFEGEWQDGLEFEVMTVLAEHYVERESWFNALDQLNVSLPKLPKKEYKERGYFLLGQLNEIIGNNEEAFEAYSKVSQNYTNYDLQFEAQKKQAEVARALGNSDEAYKVFSSMVRDDKNTEFVSELNFELGKTEQDRGNYKKAEDIYIQILRDKRIQPEAVTKARVYNGLAEINRFNYNNYEVAAAYYDSAAKVNAPEIELPEDFKAKEFAVSFGSYSELKNEIYLQDSLLWLGTLPQEKFDSVLVELERIKREEIARLQQEQEDRKNTLINVSAPRNNNNQAENIERNGFLNYKNPVLIAEASQQFRAIWNTRPLSDNWRVTALLVSNIQTQSSGDVNREGSSGNNFEEDLFVSIDLSRVPFTPQDQDSAKEDLASLNYELANLFFLSLNLPDSAEHYFTKVFNERPNSRVAPVSLYSLSELYSIQDKNEQALAKAEELVQKFPNTVYADRVIEYYGIERSNDAEEVEIDPRILYMQIISNEEYDLKKKTERLSSFEESYRGTRLAAQALYNGIENFILMAKQDSGFVAKQKEWTRVNQDWDKTLENFSIEQDSALVKLNDSTITNADSLYYSSFLDSTLTRPNLKTVFPYYGEYWDSTRSKVEQYLTLYPTEKQQSMVNRLKAEFEVPREENKVEELPENQTQDETSGNYLSCADIDQNVFIRGGMGNFLNQVEIPASAQEKEISFLFYIGIRGIIDEFKLSSETQNQDLIDTFVDAIENNISFDPVLVEGTATAVSCELTFQISR